MNREDIIRMAREVLLLDARDNPNDDGIAQFIGALSDFATLVAAAATEEANRRANASWTLMCEKMVAAEREACAKVVDEMEKQRCEAWHHALINGGEVPSMSLAACAAAIRARGETK